MSHDVNVIFRLGRVWSRAKTSLAPCSSNAVAERGRGAARARSWGVAVAALVVGFVVIVQQPLLSFLTYGTTWDERTQFKGLRDQLHVGTLVLQGNAAGIEPSKLINGLSEWHGVVNKLPGVPFWRAAQWLRGKPVAGWQWDAEAIIGFHIWTMMCLVVTAWFVLKLARYLVNDARIAWVAPALLLLDPRFVGHSFFNVKDVPFAAMYTVATLAMARAVSSTTLRAGIVPAVAAWFACGLLAAIKIPAVAASWPMLAAAVSVPLWRGRPPRHGQLAVLWALTPFVALAIAVLANPAAWIHPLEWLSTAFGIFAHHPWGGCTMLWGTCISAADVPRTFLPTWLALVTPIPLLALTIYGLGLVVRPAWHILRSCGSQLLPPNSRYAAALAVAAQMFSLPIVAIVARSPIYDGERHFLFVVPMACIVSAVAVEHALRVNAGRVVRPLLLGSGFALSLLVVVDMWRLHPYEYTYYNEIGRFLDPSRNFETDYWGYSLGELARKQHVRQATEPWLAAVPITGHPIVTLEPFWPTAVAPFDLGVEHGIVRSAYPIPATRVLVLHRFEWRDTPIGCTELDRIERRLAFAREPLVMGRALMCSPG